jgi:hypothetical protein
MNGTFHRRTLAGALAFVAGALIGVATSAAPASAAVSADINLHIGDRPAPVVVFDRAPDVVLVPKSHVYYVDHSGYDLYRYGRYWYINDSGFWFRASSYRGPFMSIAVGRVPRPIVVVPAQYRRHPVHPHGGPPGQLKKQGVVQASDGRRYIRAVDRTEGPARTTKTSAKGKGKGKSDNKDR